MAIKLNYTFAMTEMVLRKLARDDEAAFVEAVGQWDHNSGFTFIRDYKPGMRFADYWACSNPMSAEKACSRALFRTHLYLDL